MNVDILTGNKTFTDFVVSVVDSSDFYRYSLNSTANIRLTLEYFITPTNQFDSESSQCLNFRLIQDFNRNGLVEPDEIVATDFANSNFSENAESTQTLDPGEYFIGVEAINVDTNYTLNLLLKPEMEHNRSRFDHQFSTKSSRLSGLIPYRFNLI